ncbi:MAG: Hsp70 family protein [Ilumatobacter sp.]
MAYQVGIDLGTTFTAAAVHRDGRSQIFGLGTQNASIPSVVLLREDNTELTGDAAVRRALSEPERVAREFKRRLGDTTPIIVGGAPYSAEQLMARLLTRTITDIAEREGGAPDHITVTHPANWGPYKIDLLQQAIRIAGIPADRTDLLTEPEAAAISYATQERVEPGEVVAVYDLGGGTFDAAVLRRTDDGFDLIGRPEGIERMGGIDFDAAVFAHVNRALEGKLQELDPEDPMVMSGVARLREECVEAKIALSSDTDATIPVLLPGLQTEVRITRSEFESLIRPSLSDSIAAMHRALESAGITAADVSKVLLVGGSSRIPLISQMVSSELGRPVAVDADPKHAIALGAAAYAGGALASSPGAAATTAAAAAAAATAASAATSTPTPPAPATQATPAPAAQPEPPTATPPPPPAPAPSPTATEPTTPVPVAAAPPPSAASPGGPAAPTGPANDQAGGSKLPLILGGAAAAVILGVGAFVVLGGGGDDDGDTAPVDSAAEVIDTVEVQPTEVPVEDPPVETVAPTTEAPVEPEPDPGPTDAEIAADAQAALSAAAPGVAVSVSDGVATLTGRVSDDVASVAIATTSGVDGVSSVVDQLERIPPDELCGDDVTGIDRWACLTSVEFDGTTIAASFDFDNAGTQDLSIADYHLHFFGNQFEPVQAGTNGGQSDGSGDWLVWDDETGFTATLAELRIDSLDKLCVRVATPTHSIENLGSGNCLPVTQVASFSGVTGLANIRARVAPSEPHICELGSASVD